MEIWVNLNRDGNYEGKYWIRPKKHITVDELVEQYLEYASANKSVSTYESDRCRIKANLLPFFKGCLLNHITPQKLEQYKLLRIRQGAKPKTINNELRNLSHMFTMAIRWGYIGENVVRYTEKMKISKKSPRFLSEDEIYRLLHAAEGSHLYPLILCALHTGMRQSELFNLQWSDIDFLNKSITVQSKDNWHTKNYKARVLGLTPELEMAFAQLKIEQEMLGINTLYVFILQLPYAGKSNSDMGFRHGYGTFLARGRSFVEKAQKQKIPEALRRLGFKLVAGEGFEPSTFGLCVPLQLALPG